MSMEMKPSLNLSIGLLRAQYLSGALTPRALIEQLLPQLEAEDTHHIWIHRIERASLLAAADALAGRDPQQLPLFGIPFVVKDNIDVAGVPTTAGCREYAYTPAAHAFVVQRLIDAGAIVLGKTNLDQFATGLVGIRSPWGACRNALDPAYVSGGSSAGSAVAVALGLASFGLGSDTAGSGRVPAAFNNLVGLKPTLGLLSNTGMVPACRTLDCISIFALTVADAADVLAVAAVYDETDAYALRRPVPALASAVQTAPAIEIKTDIKTDAKTAASFRFGVPAAQYLEYFGNQAGPERFAAAIAALEALGGTKVEIDFAPFLATARLLYDGPWVAERYAAIADFIEAQPEALFPVTREIIGKARQITAVASFQAQYALQDLKRAAEKVWRSCDVLLTPTAPTIYTIAAVEADPIRLNSNLGYYTNYVNLLNLSALAIPAGFQTDGLPFGVTLCAPAFAEPALLSLGARLHGFTSSRLGATGHALMDAARVPDYGSVTPVHAASTGSAASVSPDHVEIAVCGAHMTGLPLNGQLIAAGAVFITRSSSAPVYRLYALPGGPPHRPGMMRSDDLGAAIELELWRMPLSAYGRFVAGIPAPLGIGMVQLSDGRSVQGFVCEAIAAEGATEITDLKGWRAYLAHLASLDR